MRTAGGLALGVGQPQAIRYTKQGDLLENVRFATQKTVMGIMSTIIKEAVCCMNVREPQRI